MGVTVVLGLIMVTLQVSGPVTPFCHGGPKKLLFDLCPICSSASLFLLIFNLNVESLIEKYSPDVAYFPPGHLLLYFLTAVL